ncbi:hypothetical protein LUW77_30700 [Streptomyces radiopugnans]|nr:hypothetical protein LUW77_30700 [Streptomyces radiopugnans]
MVSSAADALGTSRPGGPRRGPRPLCGTAGLGPARTGDLSLRHGTLGRLEALAVLAGRHHA